MPWPDGSSDHALFRSFDALDTTEEFCDDGAVMSRDHVVFKAELVADPMRARAEASSSEGFGALAAAVLSELTL